MSQDLFECLQSTLPVGEKLKTINHISKQLTLSQADEILELLKANSDYNGVKLKLADDFKRLSCVLDILENGNKSSISRAARLPWIYADGSDLIDAEFLVTTFFPRISFSTRLKIINNIGIHLRNSQTANGIFSAIEYKYGFAIASAMLPACSEEVITKLLVTKRQHELSPTQLLIVVKTAPQIGLNYFKTLFFMTEYYRGDYSSSIKYLLCHHRSEMLGLMSDHPNKWNCSLGRTMSNKILRTHSAHVMKLVEEKPDFFKHCQLRKFLTPQQYEHVFLKSESDLKSMLKDHWRVERLWKWLDHLPKYRQLDLLRKSFRVAFNKDIVKCPQYVTPDILALFPTEEKSTIIDWKLENGGKNYIHCCIFKRLPSIYSNFEWFWMAMKPTKDSLPQLTKILCSEKDCNKRSDLFQFLGMSCIFNKDDQELIKVLQFLTKRCRNDQPEIRQTLLQVMNESTFHVEFQEQHWTCFQELLQFLQLYKEVNRNSDVVVALLGKYAAYHQEQGKTFDTELNLIVKIAITSWVFYDFSHIKRPESQREIIEGCIKASSAYEEQSATQSINEDYVLELIKIILKWNRQYEKKLGPINGCSFPWLVKKCWEMVTDKDSYNTMPAFIFLKQNAILKPDIFDKLLNNRICVSILYYCLKTHPEKITENIENIVSNILSKGNVINFRIFFTFVKKLKATYCWALLNKIKDECKKIVYHGNPKSVVTEIGTAIRLLAILEPSDFLNFASNYYPVEGKIDPSIPIDELDYRIKESIAGSLKHLQNPGLLLPVIDRFLVGDYLKLSLGSLYAACIAASETQALAYLEPQMENRPVSVKKHMIRLFFMISPLDRKLKLLEERWFGEKNPSIRYEILVQIYRLFESTPNKEVWQLLKSSVASLTDVDSPGIDFVNNTTSIDESLGEFISEFVQTILETFKCIGVYQKFEANIICRISNHILKFEDNFLDSLIQDLLYKSRLATEAIYSQLAINYLIDESISPQIRIHRLNLLQKIFQNLFDHHWDATELDYNNEESLIFPTRTLLSCVCEGICDSLLYCRGKDKGGKEILQELVKQFEKIPDISSTFRDVVYMKLTLFALEIKSEDKWLQTFGQRVAPFLSYYAEKYGGEIICIISVILRDISNRMTTAVGNENILRIIDGLLSGKNDKCHLISAISLLPRSAPKSAELSKMYERVIDIIKSSSDPTAQIYLKEREKDGQMQFFNR